MERKESQFPTEAKKAKTRAESPLGGKKSAMERFINISKILEQPGADETIEKEIEIALKDMPSEEKALRIYESIVAYSLERRPEKGKSLEEMTVPDPYFISGFKQLWGDENARRIFLEKFDETRADLATHRLSKLGGNLRKIESSLQTARDQYAKLKQNLNLQKVKKPTEIKAAKARLEYQDRRMKELSDDEENIVNLKRYEHIKENTDVAAIVMYETLRRYQSEAAAGFVWLPSRWVIHKKIHDAIEHTGKAPLLIGPPGTGKTTQIEAVAKERTGVGAIRIPCHPGLSEEGLVYIRDIQGGSGRFFYSGTATEAATGYEHSSANAPAVDHGRLVLLDEIIELNMGRALGPIKDIRQAKPGNPFSRFAPYKVLPGFQLAATSNLPLEDERLDREFARIPTNYFEMTPKNPELYEFMLAKLLREEGHFPLVDKRDIAPDYQREDLPESERTRLEDGSIAVAMDRLIENPADVRHGFLYRFAYAIRAIQDSYIHGSQFNEKYLANTALYEDYDSDGNLIIKGYVTDLADKTQSPGGQMLKLKSGSSTITAEIVSKWMDGFAQSGEKDLTNWLGRMLQEHIDQASPEDAERIRAVADYFHIFDEERRTGSPEPLTPKEIGYLSPRVPRPLYVEKPIVTDASGIQIEKPPTEIKEYETRKVLLEDGSTILMRVQYFTLKNGIFDLEKEQLAPLEVSAGTKFRVGEELAIFTGVVEDETSPYNGWPIGRLANEKNLYKVFTLKDIDEGILEEFKIVFEPDLKDLEEAVEDFCREEK